MLRPATLLDAEEVRRWRNHPQVRAMSLTTHEIGPDEHAAWFAGAVTDPTRRVLIYEHAGVPAGVVTFADIGAGSAMWGFYLDVDGLEERDETLPAWMRVCREAVDYAFDDLGLDELTGDVFAGNEAVRQLNRRLGFVETGSRTVVRDGAADECLSIRLRRSERRTRPARAITTPAPAGEPAEPPTAEESA
ncbi:MAG TPA: GNAT family N-acetyltransferase [Micromonosporaceae bacterium]|nr:GNAT family N-acetyltransferase [Micromonosporaceae bacterium]